MKKYLIEISSDRGAAECVTIYGDSLRPFMIAHNLWNYNEPGHASRRLENLAKSWEKHGHIVSRKYGTVHDMRTSGNMFNVSNILQWYK